MARSKGSIASGEGEDNFPFIVSNGPGVTKDPALRTLIRKQAMKEVSIARKRRGNYGKINIRQPIVYEQTDGQIENTVFESTSASSDSSGSSGSTPETSSIGTDGTEVFEDLDVNNPVNWTVACRTQSSGSDVSYSIPWALCLDTGYERARSRFCVDVTQLTVMTNFNVSRYATQIFGADPTRLLAIMQDKEWSYLEFLPSMYDSSKPLAAATDCLLAKASQVLMPHTTNERVELALYTKALRTLQDAISNPCTSYAAETLAAIQLMSLHELLDPTREAAWSSHVEGAARLMRHRTPKRFKTEFEKALFAGHVGPMVSEALMNNEHCYLAEKEWLELYSSTVKHSTFLTERSELVIDTRKLMLQLPGLWHDVDKTLRGDGLFNDRLLADLETRLRTSHAEHLEWLEDYKSHCLRTSLAQPPTSEIGLRREIFGATLECLCLVKRLLACVCDADRPALEIEAQSLAKFMLELQQQPGPRHSWLFTPHEVGVATSIQASQDAFEENVSNQDLESRRFAMRRRYFAWNGLLRKEG